MMMMMMMMISFHLNLGALIGRTHGKRRFNVSK